MPVEFARGNSREEAAPGEAVDLRGGRTQFGEHPVVVFDRQGNLYVTYSGTRGQEVPVSIFRVRPNGTRETFSSGIVNPTSMAFDRQGRLYVSSRFEGIVYRVGADGTPESFASDLGVACGLAFAPDGALFVGDRSGTIFRVNPDGKAAAFASLGTRPVAPSTPRHAGSPASTACTPRCGRRSRRATVGVSRSDE